MADTTIILVVTTPDTWITGTDYPPGLTILSIFFWGISSIPPQVFPLVFETIITVPEDTPGYQLVNFVL